ncbi:hypothetical protein EDC01DRAFT_789699 [Geopyxis carbonaria]|nr:hypothetical protein EDC01DRAFT_789699 [Geopyxis carbonaria]
MQFFTLLVFFLSSLSMALPGPAGVAVPSGKLTHGPGALNTTSSGVVAGANENYCFGVCTGNVACAQVFPDSCYCENDNRRKCAARCGMKEVTLMDCDTMATFTEAVGKPKAN